MVSPNTILIPCSSAGTPLQEPLGADIFVGGAEPAGHGAIGSFTGDALFDAYTRISR